MSDQNTSTPNTVPVQNPLPKKHQGVWKLRLMIASLLLLLTLVLVGAGVGGYYGYQMYDKQHNDAETLRRENDELKKVQDSSKTDLQKSIEDLKIQTNDLQDQNKKLTTDLNNANSKVNQLTPKDIRDVKYDTLKQINKQAGDFWLDPIYADLNGDGKLDALFAYRAAGQGAFLNVYVYSYTDNVTLTQVLKSEGYQDGSVSIVESNIVEIKSTTGTPENKQNVVARFKYDAGQKKLVQLVNQKIPS